MDAGSGNDVILSRNCARDPIDGGAGRDRTPVNRSDRLRDVDVLSVNGLLVGA